jgi:hypothetical protein
MADTNWFKFQREVDWTPEVYAAISNLSIEIPPEGRPLPAADAGKVQGNG